MAKKIPAFDYEICMACNICAEVCPVSCINMKKSGVVKLKKAYPFLALPESCTGCSLCMNACPVDAITMERIILQGAKQVLEQSLDPQ